ncbi:MAG TPA: hypothetical protein VJT84_13230 [Gaiellaceae bacterium]|nr:hypothetical protein [Gaiellaceae bacterium]
MIEADLRGPQAKSDPSVFFDLGGSGSSDIARFKDQYVGEAVDAGRARR